MEHVQPFHRPFPWRLTTLVASALVLVALGGLVLTYRTSRTSPATAPDGAPKRPPAAPLRPRSRLSVLVLILGAN